MSLPTHLSTLPPELFESILLHLDITTIKAFSQCSQFFHNVSLPFLFYSSVLSREKVQLFKRGGLLGQRVQHLRHLKLRLELQSIQPGFTDSLAEVLTELHIFPAVNKLSITLVAHRDAESTLFLTAFKWISKCSFYHNVRSLSLEAEICDTQISAQDRKDWYSRSQQRDQLFLGGVVQPGEVIDITPPTSLQELAVSISPQRIGKQLPYYQFLSQASRLNRMVITESVTFPKDFEDEEEGRKLSSCVPKPTTEPTVPNAVFHGVRFLSVKITGYPFGGKLKYLAECFPNLEELDLVLDQTRYRTAVIDPDAFLQTYDGLLDMKKLKFVSIPWPKVKNPTCPSPLRNTFRKSLGKWMASDQTDSDMIMLGIPELEKWILYWRKCQLPLERVQFNGWKPVGQWHSMRKWATCNISKDDRMNRARQLIWKECDPAYEGLREYLRSFLQEGNREILPLGLCNRILSFSSIETIKNFARCSKWSNDISQPHLAHTVKSRNNNLALFLPDQRLWEYRKYIRRLVIEDQLYEADTSALRENLSRLRYFKDVTHLEICLDTASSLTVNLLTAILLRVSQFRFYRGLRRLSIEFSSDYVNPGFAALKNDDLWNRITWDDQKFLEYPMAYTRLYALVGRTIPPALSLEEININKGYQTIIGLGTLAELLCLSPKAKLLTAGQFDSGIWEDRKLNPSAKTIYMSPAHPLCYTLTALEVTMLKNDLGEAVQVIVREFPGLESFVLRASESFFTIKQPKAVRKAWLYTQLKTLKKLKKLAIPWPCYLQSAEYKKYRRGRGYASGLARTEEEA
ncbi:hypothetical protein TWF788_007531 [Orbilia oligospora]|uniref:F-box domain-containing protein n=2 Tax=Orbilia oligospora TaxID=2813651 RepID=A0A7C8PSP8_ORBOL|nr:hypothetical protein TWF788_007531 [Orbilia oligospora]